MTSFVAKFIHPAAPAAPRLGSAERVLGSFRAMSGRIGAAYETGRAYDDARDAISRQRVLDGYSARLLHRNRA